MRNSLLPLTKKLIDDEYEVRSEDNLYIKKRNQNFIVLFCNENIEIRRTFLDNIKAKILNGENIRLFHAGMDLCPTPTKIKNLEIYNDVKNDLTNFLIEYYNTSSIKDSIDIIILYTIFDLLSKTSSNTPISYFFREFANSLIKDIDFSLHFLKSEDNTLELKTRDFIVGTDKEIIEKLKKDIEKKIKESRFKLYILGADEKTKKIEPLPINQFNDTRIQNLEKNLQETFKNTTIRFVKISSKEGDECVLICYVLSERSS